MSEEDTQPSDSQHQSQQSDRSDTFNGIEIESFSQLNNESVPYDVTQKWPEQQSSQEAEETTLSFSSKPGEASLDEPVSSLVPTFGIRAKAGEIFISNLAAHPRGVCLLFLK